jgi:anti-sigma factor RsiW
MNEFDSLREKSWRRKLTPAEEASLRAWLAEHPEDKANCELDGELNRSLEKLANVPMPSNFTARVLQAIERESMTATQPSPNRMRWFLRSLLPKGAVAGAIFAVGVLTYHEHTVSKRAELARDMKTVAGVRVPGPEILQDFDTIRQVTGPDPELIALMK